MTTHPLDLLSLTFGVILTGITAVLALSIWTDVVLDLGLVLPVALICSGALALVVALVPRHPDEDTPTS